MIKKFDIEIDLGPGALWGIVLICVALIFSSCGDSSAQKSGVAKPPPTPVYDYYEIEPNDTLDEAQFVTVLPRILASKGFETLSAEFDYDNGHADIFKFFLMPPAFRTELFFNCQVRFDPTMYVMVNLFQTVYDQFGGPVNFITLKTFVGVNGLLEIEDLKIPYDFRYSNDLYIEVIPLGMGDKEYFVDFYVK